MHLAKKIMATLLPTGLLLIGSAGIAAADTSSTTMYWNPNWNYWNSGSTTNDWHPWDGWNSGSSTNGWNWGSTTNNWNSGTSSNSNWHQWDGWNSGGQNGWQNNNDGMMFSANTYGHNEIPPVPDMTPGHFMLRENSNSSTSSLMYTYMLQNGKGITMAHLHCAPPGENGPSVVTLYMSMGQNINGTLTSGNIGNSDILPSAKGCADTIGYAINDTQDLMSALEDGDIYVNAHSMDYPDGISRGQLSQDDSNQNGTTWNHSGNYWNDSSTSTWNDRSDTWDNNRSNWNDSDNSNWHNWNDDSDQNWDSNDDSDE